MKISGTAIEDVSNASVGPWTVVPGIAGKSVPKGIRIQNNQSIILNPGETRSDWFVPPKKARTDGGDGFLFDVMVQSPAGNGLIFGSNLERHKGWVRSGLGDDWVTTTPPSLTLVSAARAGIWLEVEAAGSVSSAKKKIIINGDSIFAGANPTTAEPWAIAGIESAGCVPYFVATGGQQVSASRDALMRNLAASKADAVILQVYSVNDQLKTGGSSPESAISDALTLREKLLALGYDVFLVGPFPSSDAAVKTNLTTARNSLKSLGVDFWDPGITGCVAPDSDFVPKAGYLADKYHPNDTGSTAWGTDFGAWLSSRI